jgi:hypothetical protein
MPESAIFHDRGSPLEGEGKPRPPLSQKPLLCCVRRGVAVALVVVQLILERRVLREAWHPWRFAALVCPELVFERRGLRCVLSQRRKRSQAVRCSEQIGIAKREVAGVAGLLRLHVLDVVELFHELGGEGCELTKGIGLLVAESSSTAG